MFLLLLLLLLLLFFGFIQGRILQAARPLPSLSNVVADESVMKTDEGMTMEQRYTVVSVLASLSKKTGTVAQLGLILVARGTSSKRKDYENLPICKEILFLRVTNIVP